MVLSFHKKINNQYSNNLMLQIKIIIINNKLIKIKKKMADMMIIMMGMRFPHKDRNQSTN